MQPFDALTMRAILSEAKPLLINRKVDKIQQISRDELVIPLRSRAGTGYLMVSAQASFGRICLLLNPLSPKTQNTPAFCQLARKYLTAATLVDLEQLPGERIVDLKFNCVDELGVRSDKILTAEIMGRHSNLILWDKETEKILAASHNVTAEMSRQREVAPGLRYCRPPRQEKLGIFEVSQKDFQDRFLTLKESFDLAEAQTFEQWLIAKFAGIGRNLAEEIVDACLLPSTIDLGSLNDDTCTKLWSRILLLQGNTDYKPAMRTDLSSFTVLSWCKELPEADSQESDWKVFPSVNDMVDAYYRAVQLRTEIQQLKDRIKAELKSEQDKLLGRLEAANKLLSDSCDSQRYKNSGDLILANAHLITAGQEVLSCADLFAGNDSQLSIELNPNVSASQNAQNYYRLYAKSRTRIKTAELSKQDSEKNLQELRAQQAELDNAQTLPELQIMKERILDRGKKITPTIKPQMQGTRDRPRQQKLLSIKSSDGLNIIVGRNKNENDFLISKLAQSHDIWMHAQGLEGAHVLVKVLGKKDPPMTTLKEAAQLAARFSRTGLGGKIKVAYTYAKYVRKIAKDKPGLVRYENEKTLEVDTAAPMPASLRKLFS